MTNTDIAVASNHVDRRAERALVPAVALTMLVAALSAVVDVPTWLSVTIAAIVVAGIGIPHGAVDHLVADTLADGPTSRRRFMVTYVAAMLAVGLVWLVSPVVALTGFLVMSIHHFGQSDLARLHLGGVRQLVLQWSRGILVVGLPLVAHVGEVAPTINRLVGVDLTSWAWLVDSRWSWCALLIAQHALVMVTVLRTQPQQLAREAIVASSLSAVLLAADPLLGFAMYFGLWHSLAHVVVLGEVLGTTQPHPVRTVVRLAAPLTLVSLAGIGAVALAFALIGRPEWVVSIVIVAVSMLTLPHMIVVERLWRHRSAR